MLSNQQIEPSDDADLDTMLSQLVSAATSKVSVPFDQPIAHCGTFELTSLVAFDRAKLEEFVRSKVSLDGVVTWYVSDSNEKLKKPGLLHINFTSEEKLVEEMVKTTSEKVGERLVRCYTNEHKHCGNHFTKFPEYVKLQVEMGWGNKNVAKPINYDEVQVQINKVLGHNVLIDRIWGFNNVNGGKSRNRVIHARFHLGSDVQMLVEAEKKFSLWGEKVLVEVPNVSSLIRCSHCEGRGHLMKEERMSKVISVCCKTLLYQTSM